MERSIWDKWAKRQRANELKMSAERKRRLKEIGFILGETRNQTWEQGFAALTTFKRDKGHCFVPALYIEDAVKLGKWVANQRRLRNNLLPERTRQLNSIGFVWDVLEAEWEEGFAALTKFKASKGHCRVPWHYKDGTFNLGQWAKRQRMKKSNMSADQKDRLDSIGFVWNALQNAWEEGFAALTTFKEREGNCLVPQRHVEGAFKLGKWVEFQRRMGDRMLLERKQRLDAIEFVWRAK
jgi:hypothetical protein